jgi:hypothetical protein
MLLLGNLIQILMSIKTSWAGETSLHAKISQPFTSNHAKISHGVMDLTLRIWIFGRLFGGPVAAVSVARRGVKIKFT